MAQPQEQQKQPAQAGSNTHQDMQKHDSKDQQQSEDTSMKDTQKQ